MGVSMGAAGSAMRFTPLLLLVMIPLGAGWLSPKAAPVSPLEAPQPFTAATSHEEPLRVDETPTSARRAAESPALMPEAVAASPAFGMVTTTAAYLPLLPINPLLEEGATSERYAEWYKGTPTELLCQSLIRLSTLRRWDPKTCSCVNSELLLKRTKAHDQVHSLHKQDELLKKEEGWLRTEVQRQVQADLKSGGSLEVFRLPRTQVQMSEALEGSSREERAILRNLLREARSAARHAAVEGEFAAGNYRVEKKTLHWG